MGQPNLFKYYNSRNPFSDILMSHTYREIHYFFFLMNLWKTYVFYLLKRSIVKK